MTAVVVTLAVVVAVLAVLVVGLLRSHAEILRRLHEMGAGVGDGGNASAPRHAREARAVGGPEGAGRRGRSEAAQGTGTSVVPPVVARTLPLAGGPAATAEPAPTAAPGVHPAVISGTTPEGDPLAVRTDHRDDTILLFLSTGCATCAAFWDALRDTGTMRLPTDARLVVVTRDLGEESPSALAALAPARVTVVASSAAWTAFGVEGSPYVVHLEAGTGGVRGEGTGASWDQVARLLAEATGDLAYGESNAGRPGAASRSRRRRQGARAVERERRTDHALLAAGIRPGDERLYRAAVEEGPAGEAATAR